MNYGTVKHHFAPPRHNANANNKDSNNVVQHPFAHLASNQHASALSYPFQANGNNGLSQSPRQARATRSPRLNSFTPIHIPAAGSSHQHASAGSLPGAISHLSLGAAAGNNNDAGELLASLLPYRLHLVDIKKRNIPLVTFPLLRLFLQTHTNSYGHLHQRQASALNNSNHSELYGSFLSYTEADAHSSSLVIDVDSLSTLQREVHALHNNKAASLIKTVGPVLRAIQVLEGTAGMLDNTSIISNVSTVLAKAGFSIFYVSTNAADFVLCKESELKQVIDTLASEFRLIRDETLAMSDEPSSRQRQYSESNSTPAQQQPQSASSPSAVGLSESESTANSPNTTSESPNIAPHSHVSDSASPAYTSVPHSRPIKSTFKPRPRKWSVDDGAESSDDSSHSPTRYLLTNDADSLPQQPTKSQERRPSLSARHSRNGSKSHSPARSSLAHVNNPPRVNTDIAATLSGINKESPSGGSGKKLQLRILPHTLCVLSLHRRALPSITHALLNLLFFPSHGITTARFFSYTVIDDDISIITTADTYQTLAAALPQGQFAGSTQYLRPSANNTADGSEEFDVIHRSQLDEYLVVECLGYFDPDQVGLVSSISQPLAEAKISFFYYSTFRTGFVLIKQSDLQRAIDALSDEFEIAGDFSFENTLLHSRNNSNNNQQTQWLMGHSGGM